MVKSFSSGNVETHFSAAGPVKLAGARISMNYGIEQPKGLYAYSKVSAGNEFLGNSKTDESFNTKLYPTFGGGLGFNRKDKGFFADVVSEYKVGVDRTTKALSEVGRVFNVQSGMRLARPDAPSLFNEVGGYARSESYSLKAHNLNFDNKSAGLYVSTEFAKNFKGTLSGGVQQNDHSKLSPAAEIKFAYNF